jgi:hypothetical protein
MCSSPGEHFQHTLISAAPGTLQGTPLHKGKVKEIKRVQFFRSLCENLETMMLMTQDAHCSKASSVQKVCEIKCTQVMKY